MIQRVLKHWEEHGYGLWAVVSRQTGELMGRAGLQLIPETGEVEADVILGVPYWGQGFATEAIGASLRFAAERLSVGSIVGIVHPENEASKRLLEKVGMTFVEEAIYFGMKCHRYAMRTAG
jgi:ribosomal-protein-alanine N-acetyltransferase